MYYSGIDLHSDNCYITTVGRYWRCRQTTARRKMSVNIFSTTSIPCPVLIRQSSSLPQDGMAQRFA